MREGAAVVRDRIDHVAITVSNIQAAIRWYQTSFTCTLVHEDKTQAVLEFDNIRLALVLPSHQPPHLAFQRSDAALLGELQERAGGVRSSYLADPTGNVVEIVEESCRNEVENAEES